MIAREGQNLAWVRANKLRDYPMPPADIPLIPHLIDLLMMRAHNAGPDMRLQAPAPYSGRPAAMPGHSGDRFTASARLAFAEPGRSGCCWLSCGAQPDSQMMSKVARMRPSGSAKRSA